MRGEDLALLAGDVLCAAVVVSERIPDLHVHLHAVVLVAAHNGRHDNQGVLGDEVPDAALLAVVLAGRLHVELEGLYRGDEQHNAAQVVQQ